MSQVIFVSNSNIK